MAQPNKCPLCAGFDANLNHSFTLKYERMSNDYRINCARCGDYNLHSHLFDDNDGIRRSGEAKLLYLSQLARQLSERQEYLRLSWDNWHDYDVVPRPPSAATYYEAVLLELAARCKYPGNGTPPLSLVESAARHMLPTLAMIDIANQLAEAGLLKVSSADRLGYRAALTIEGWQRVDKLTLRRDPSRRAFVAMWFDPSLNPAYDAVAKVLTAEGYVGPFRVDDAAHAELPEGERHSKIDDRILAEIRGSRFVIADFTGNRQAVYYEAGFADGLGIPVLWCCQAGAHFDALNFDTRQHEHIKWTEPADLASQLQAKIRRHGWSWTR
jgi:hypothetical protein